MSTPSTGWRIWLLAGLCGVAVIGAVLLLFRLPRAMRPEPAKVRPSPPVAVGLVPWTDGSVDSLLKEETMLRDPTPLFLPTPWNAAENAVPADAHRDPGNSFQDYPAKTAFDVTELTLNFPVTVQLPERPEEAFATNKPARPFIGFGQTDFALTPLPERRAFVEVVAEGDGVVVMAEPLREAQPPGDGAWQPLEFLVAVDPSGLVRPPVLTESSQVAAVDGYFQDYLANRFHIGERLAPGFYRICVGP